MINLMKADLYRIVKTKGFIIFWLISIMVSMTSIALQEPGGILLGGDFDLNGAQKLDIKQTAMNLLYYFLLIMPVFGIITAEFTEHTIKNTITSAVSKGRFYVAKTLFAIVYCLSCFLGANYIFYFVNRAVNGSKYSSSLGEFSKVLFGQFPVFVAIVSLFIFLAFFFKKGAAFNSIVIISPLVYSVILSILCGIESAQKITEKLIKFEVSTMIGNLALGCSQSYRTDCYIVSAAVTVISCVLGYITWKNREV